MKQTHLIMGMPITVEIETMDASVFDAVFEHFREIDRLFSTYKPTSEISRLNRGDLALEDCSIEVQKVIEACDQFKRSTMGYFDIYQLDRIDPSGYVKGWAISQAAKLVMARGITNYYIDAGGDIQTGGHNAKAQPWRIGIKHPHKPGKFAKVVELSNAAIATSGTYERGHHIYNPLTGKAVTEIESLSVIGPDILTADVVATAAFAMGTATGLEFVMRQKLEGYLITVGGQTYATPGFSRYAVPNG